MGRLILQTRTTVASDIELDNAIAGVAEGPPPRPAPDSPRRSVPRHAGGVLLALTCIAAAWWYVPRVVGTDIVNLNFAQAGDVASVLVNLGARVRKGELLATEAAPAAQAVIRAD